MATVNLSKEPRQRTRNQLPIYSYSLISVVAVLLVMVFLGFYYLNRVERENDREWCDLVVFYTDYYRENPPQTELQKKHLALMERRRIDLGCS